MAYSITPKSGSKYLCAHKCKHVDCLETRAVIAFECPLCGKSIGEDVKWMRDARNRPVHALCAWKDAEANR